MALCVSVANLSGETISLQVDPEHSVAELMRLLELRSVAPILGLVTSKGLLQQHARLKDALGGELTATMVHGRRDQCYKQRHCVALRLGGAVAVVGRKGRGALRERLSEAGRSVPGPEEPLWIVEELLSVIIRSSTYKRPEKPLQP
ncbi:unnamed protein product [Durusdinium trenchii]|uniref:Uncharacterized protein n=1 Tax=Durusdinium trenchii TaxID=1381693 RepID=A0ABP0KSH6_9DINO